MSKNYYIQMNGLFNPSLTIFDDEDPDAATILPFNPLEETTQWEGVREHRGIQIQPGDTFLYTPPTIEEIDAVLSQLGTREIERPFVIHTGPRGEEMFQQALRDEIGHWQYPESTSITRTIPYQEAIDMTPEELINYLDQISREDV